MRIELRNIVTEEFQRNIQDSFAHATGVGVIFVDREGRHIGQGANFCKLCSRINATEAGKQACALSNRRAISHALKNKKPCLYVCHAGLVNIEIPLIYSGEYIGAITAGQILCDAADAFPKDGEDEPIDWRADPFYASCYGEIETLPWRRIQAITQALYNISNYVVQTLCYDQNQRELLLYQKRQIELEHRLKSAELDALQKQVAPHFIFNVLGSVSRLISMKEYGTAEKMLHSFSQMLRYSLGNLMSSVTLKRELAYIENYLSIQQIRFGERLRYSVSCDPALESMEVPFFSLQPLVENALEHGLLHLERGGEIGILCAKGTACAEISVTDNGAGLSPEALREIRAALLDENPKRDEKHLGLRNSCQRLKYLYGDRFSFEITGAVGQGVQVLLKIPL